MTHIKNIISKTDYENFIASGNKIVKFGAEWCFPCKVLSNTIVNLDVNKLGGYSFGEVDVDEEFAENITKELGIKNVPVLIFFKDGKEINRTTGIVPAEEFYKLFATC